jgi:hypothetical protein
MTVYPTVPFLLRNKPIKPLERVLMDNGISFRDAAGAGKMPAAYNTPDYYSVASAPSAVPARQCFCTVCGYIGTERIDF